MNMPKHMAPKPSHVCVPRFIRRPPNASLLVHENGEQAKVCVNECSGKPPFNLASGIHFNRGS